LSAFHFRNSIIFKLPAHFKTYVTTLIDSDNCMLLSQWKLLFKMCRHWFYRLEMIVAKMH